MEFCDGAGTSCGITSVAAAIASLVRRENATVHQHMREPRRLAARKAMVKRGGARQALDVTTCFVPLLRWVLAWRPPAESRVILATDARTAGPTLHGAGNQPDLSGQRHPACLGHAAGAHARGEAAPSGTDVHADPAGGAHGMDGHRRGGSRVVDAMAVSPHPDARLEHLSAYQWRWNLSSGGRGRLSPADPGRAAGETRMEWSGDLLFQPRKCRLQACCWLTRAMCCAMLLSVPAPRRRLRACCWPAGMTAIPTPG